MVDRLKDKVAIITGGAGAIGKAAARRFLDEGAQVLLADMNESALAEAVTELGSNAVSYCVCNVTSSADNQALIETAESRYGGVDVFLANAGIEGDVRPIAEYDEERFDQVMAVNVKGVFLGLKHAMPAIARRGGGSIVVTSSVAGLSGTPGVAPYVTSKHAVIGLMRSAAQEGAAQKVRVNTVNPSMVYGRMMESLEAGMAPGDGAKARQSMERSVPLGRYATPDDIAKVMLFLASDEAEFVTGAVYVADGGLSS